MTKNTAKLFQSMTYRQVQKLNSQIRLTLRKDDQIWLKQQGFRNVGWSNVIKLYENISAILERYDQELPGLDELFIEADCIGNKYLDPNELQEYQSKLADQNRLFEEQVDQRFPDTEVEMIDFR
ncbi:MAG: hypothetical protein ACK456_03855 [Pseudanabaenaceae cyanobacterium]|jgi:hypothetical protein